MVEEFPDLDNEGLLRKLQKIPDDKPLNLGTRGKMNYRTQFKLWDDARADSAKLNQGFREIEMSEITSFSPEVGLPPIATNRMSTDKRYDVSDRIGRFSKEKNYQALFGESQSKSGIFVKLSGLMVKKHRRDVKN